MNRLGQIYGPAAIALVLGVVGFYSFDKVMKYMGREDKKAATTPSIGTLKPFGSGVRYRAESTVFWDDLSHGDQTVHSEDAVFTDGQSRASISFFNQDEIEIQPNSMVVLRGFETGAKEPPSLVVEKGAIKVKTSPKRRPMVIVADKKQYKIDPSTVKENGEITIQKNDVTGVEVVGDPEAKITAYDADSPMNMAMNTPAPTPVPTVEPTAAPVVESTPEPTPRPKPIVHHKPKPKPVAKVEPAEPLPPVTAKEPSTEPDVFEPAKEEPSYEDQPLAEATPVPVPAVDDEDSVVLGVHADGGEDDPEPEYEVRPYWKFGLYGGARSISISQTGGYGEQNLSVFNFGLMGAKLEYTSDMFGVWFNYEHFPAKFEGATQGADFFELGISVKDFLFTFNDETFIVSRSNASGGNDVGGIELSLLSVGYKHEIFLSEETLSSLRFKAMFMLPLTTSSSSTDLRALTMSGFQLKGAAEYERRIGHFDNWDLFFNGRLDVMYKSLKADVRWDAAAGESKSNIFQVTPTIGVTARF
ncbi:MAG: hypothetical protein JST80_13615 [Bdellovibrionales bacterium]|nr:hypothetical protein [Bdellovibrionales bacterium]